MIRGIDIELGGKTFVVPPLTLGFLETIEPRLMNFKAGIDKESIGLVLDCAYVALKRNYPDITRDELKELIDVGNMPTVMQAIMGVSGLKTKDAAPGEAKAGKK